MQQLNLLSYQPTPEEMEVPAFKLGDRVQCPEGIGKVYYLQPGCVWVERENVAKPFDSNLVQPAPIESTPPKSSPSVNQHALDWHQGNLRYYQRLQIRFFDAAHAATLAGNADRAVQRMRSHEIERLQELCNAERAKIQALQEVC